MPLEEELGVEVKKIFDDLWSTRSGQVVPSPEDLKLGNDAVEFGRATILYADLSGSTALVDSKSWYYSAEIYKTYLLCAAKIIRSEGGVITSYDGDRIMGVFIGNSQSTSAARCGLKINYAVQFIINPLLLARYPTGNYTVRQVVGVDTSPIRATRTGVRGGNDIVWVGRAANHAAKLTNLNMDERTWITKDVYDKINDSQKLGGSQNLPIWKLFNWIAHENLLIYGSAWWWKVNM